MIIMNFYTSPRIFCKTEALSLIIGQAFDSNISERGKQFFTFLSNFRDFSIFLHSESDCYRRAKRTAWWNDRMFNERQAGWKYHTSQLVNDDDDSSLFSFTHTSMEVRPVFANLLFAMRRLVLVENGGIIELESKLDYAARENISFFWWWKNWKKMCLVVALLSCW